MIRPFLVALPLAVLLAACERDAGRTGGPAAPVGNSGVTEGPPSVS